MVSTKPCTIGFSADQGMADPVRVLEDALTLTTDDRARIPRSLTPLSTATASCSKKRTKRSCAKFSPALVAYARKVEQAARCKRGRSDSPDFCEHGLPRTPAWLVPQPGYFL